MKAGLLDFLSPQAGPKTDARADELVTELLEVAAGTNGGSKAQTKTREQLEELVRAYNRSGVPTTEPTSVLSDIAV